MRKSSVAVLTLAILALSVASSVRITISALPVHNENTGLDYATIQAAIDAPQTQNGHTITIDPGTYLESVNVSKSLALIGKDELTTIIDAQNSMYGILTRMDDVVITSLTVQNALGGISVDAGNRFTISRNRVMGCSGHGVHVEGPCGEGRVINNTIIGYGPAGVGLWLSNCWNATILENNVLNWLWGISLYDCSGCILRRNNAHHNRYNMGTAAETLAGYINDVDTSNTVDGKLVYYLLNESNRVIASPDVGYVALVNCVNMTVRDLNLTKNRKGITLLNTINSTLRSNLCSENWEGIEFNYNSTNNRIYENTLSLNEYGLVFNEPGGSSGNKIYHNIFEANNIDTTISSLDTNIWDDWYPSGGNYWSEYVDVDQYSGPYQNMTGSDGIWDHPYVINVNNTDNYPLKNRPGTTSTFSVVLKNRTYPALLFSDGWIVGFSFNQSSKTIMFQASESSFVDATIPKALLDGAMNVSINDKTIASVLTWNNTHTVVSISLNTTEKVIVKIRAEIAMKLPITMFPDIDSDCYIGIKDLYLVASMFGESCP